MKIRKAVIPAAGLGTRVLPATKSMPKEMLPIVDKPAIQYIVEEAVAAGIEEILIITGRNKQIIEDHFDHSPELETSLTRPVKEKMLEECLGIANMADIFFIRQKETKGLGHAISKARAFTKDEPFVVLYGDDVIMGEDPVAAQLCRAYEQYGKPCVGIKEVTATDITKYSSLQVNLLKDNLYNVTDMIEKPAKGQEFSLYSILGRCLLTPEIYEILDRTKPGAGGEIQLTDAMAEIARNGGMTGVDFTGTRYDMGSKLGIMQAQVETALKHPEIGADFKEYLKKIAQSL
ncbi:MAG: UTP--glucose-1-phosphate uridylyltransferase GalU [Oscillospiraceae bacterium]